MGLFDGEAKKEAEKYVYQALSKLPILDDLVRDVVSCDEEWIIKCQSYYDDHIRKVTIAADLFEIKWSKCQRKGDRTVENVNARVGFAYTLSGYMPIHNHVNEKGKEDVSVGRVIYLWGLLVREHMKERLPGCQFGNLTEYEEHTTFSYTVPELEWKRWF